MIPLLSQIQNAQSVTLSTHSQPDGDGIGSQVALYWAFKKMGKEVRIVNVDAIPKKYDFLNANGIIECLDNLKAPLADTELAFVFDTNDPDLLLGLWSQLKNHSKQIIFVDHHPVLNRYPLKVDEHIIDTQASSTGQIVFNLIKALQVPLDAKIALPLYTSIVFDTNYFRYIRGSPTPHLIAAELLRHDIEPNNVHRNLFGNHSMNKLKFLGQILGMVEFELEGRLGLVKVKKEDMKKLDVEMDETNDIVDMIMDVQSIEAAVLFREEAEDEFKISFRSRGIFNVDQLAQTLGGGGHQFASGVHLKGPYAELKAKVLAAFATLFKNKPSSSVSS